MSTGTLGGRRAPSGDARRAGRSGCGGRPQRSTCIETARAAAFRDSHPSPRIGGASCVPGDSPRSSSREEDRGGRLAAGSALSRRLLGAPPAAGTDRSLPRPRAQCGSLLNGGTCRRSGQRDPGDRAAPTLRQEGSEYFCLICLDPAPQRGPVVWGCPPPVRGPTHTPRRSLPGSPAPRPGRGRRCPTRSCTLSTSLPREGEGWAAAAGPSRHPRGALDATPQVSES